MQSILNLGVDMIVGLQSVGRWPTLPMEAFSFLGTETFYVITLPFLYWCVDSAPYFFRCLKLAERGPETAFPQ